ncbi:MAG: hypothetical protein IJ647_01150 [Prevotella sp.]|nr:hypothetical protein [Prevotella sp.]
MTLRIKDLFKTESAQTPEQAAIPQPQNPNNRQEGETYRHWGLRVCAIANGSNYVLKPYLHNVYGYIHKKQVENEVLQEEERRKTQSQIEQKRNDIEVLNSQLNDCKQRQQDKKDKISELNAEKKELKNKAYEVNKTAKLKLILGLIILVPLTFYLFLFYSSTFYSAFFKNFGASATVMNSMFDAEALSKALETSVTELCFVLCAPIIFMGLGFSLHFFTIQKTWTKYIKMAAILCITFIFDAILAYMIGKHLYEMEVIIGIAPIGSAYGFSDAVSDINTWAVIFCGFIVYIIWGIVFDMAMSAYDQLDLNNINIKAIGEQVKALEGEIDAEKQKELGLNNQINSLNNDISGLTVQLFRTAIIDNGTIRTEMTNFFTGWAAQMNVLGMTQQEQHEANATFENTINALLND